MDYGEQLEPEQGPMAADVLQSSATAASLRAETSGRMKNPMVGAVACLHDLRFQMRKVCVHSGQILLYMISISSPNFLKQLLE